MRDLFANLIARFRAASRQERLYVALAFVAALVVVRYGMSWLLDYRHSVKDDIRLSADRLATARRSVERAPEIAKEVETLRARYRETVSELVPGDSPTLAAASLQDRVSSLAAEKNVSIQTTQVMKDEAMGPFRKVSLRITASAELLNLADFLGGIEFGSPKVSIPFIELSRRGATLRGQQGTRVVSATVEIAGVIQGSAALPVAPGGQPPAPAQVAGPEAPSAANPAPLAGPHSRHAPAAGKAPVAPPLPNIPGQKAPAKNDPLALPGLESKR